MKKIQLSLIVLIAIGTFVHAGGDFSTVTPYEAEDFTLAEETEVEEVYVPPVPVVAKSIEVVETAVVEPPKVKVKDIHANGFYVGLGIATTRYKTNCSSTCAKSGTDKTLGVTARAGYDFNQYIGIEARGIRTSAKSNGGTVKHAGVFIKPMLPVGDATNVYGLVGLAKTTTQGSLQRTNAETLALGAGVEVDLSKDIPKDGRYGRTFDGKGDQEKGIGLFIDYERMVVKSGAPDLDAVSAGVTYDF
jgi:opacity protein-like surface antigen